MKKKSITIILGAILIVAICVISPIFLSGIQDCTVIGKIHTEKMKDRNGKKLPFWEKLLVYAENKNQVSAASPQETVGRDREEELTDRAYHMAENVREELLELRNRKLLPSEIPVEYIADNMTFYEVQTYIGDSNDTVTIWKLGIFEDNYEYYISIEETTGKIIELQVLNFGLRNYDGNQIFGDVGESELSYLWGAIYELPYAWGEYLGAENEEVSDYEESGEFDKETIRGECTYSKEGNIVNYEFTISKEVLEIKIYDADLMQ